MDNIIIEKIWIDSNPLEDLFQVKITASNDRVCMSSNVFMQSQHLIKLKKNLDNLIKKPLILHLEMMMIVMLTVLNLISK